MLTIEDLERGLSELIEILELAVEEDDQALFSESEADLQKHLENLAQLEFQRMFAGPMDLNPAYLEIQAGSGGTEAQDWADMLLRMYLKWCERKGFKSEIIELSDGDVAGIKSATVWSKELMRTVGCELKLVFIAWFESRLLILVTAGTHRSPQFLFHLILMTTSISIWICPMCVWIRTEPAVPVVST